MFCWGEKARKRTGNWRSAELARKNVLRNRLRVAGSDSGKGENNIKTKGERE